MTKSQSQKIEELYIAMFSRLYGVALAALRDASLAEEAVQDTFRIACSKPTALLSSANPEGWLMNTLKNVLMKIRSQRAQDEAFILPLLTEHENLVGACDDTKPDILELLSDDDKKVLMLTVLEGKTMLEASHTLGISLEACKKRAQRARKRLRAVLIEADEKE